MSGRSGRHLAKVPLAGVLAAACLVVPSEWASSSAGAAYAPSVQTMVVGLGEQVLAPARTVSASATSVRAGSRSCAVAAGTPLAVLAAERRAGPGFALRDYGRCNGSPANSGQLFVYSLGGQSNRGQSGWEYKVDGAAGSTGAADTSGPFGNGRRLRTGDQVLWFYCDMHAGGCQRSLVLSYPSTPPARGGSLTVTVYGADNEGRLSYEPGAVVSLGGRLASAGAYGHATLRVPTSAGRYAISATRGGAVPSFPGTIVVR